MPEASESWRGVPGTHWDAEKRTFVDANGNPVQGGASSFDPLNPLQSPAVVSFGKQAYDTLNPATPYNTLADALTGASGQATALSDLQWQRQMQGLDRALGHVGNSQSLWNSVYGQQGGAPRGPNPTGPTLAGMLPTGANGGPRIPGDLKNIPPPPSASAFTRNSQSAGQPPPSSSQYGDVGGAVNRYTSGLTGQTAPPATGNLGASAFQPPPTTGLAQQLRPQTAQQGLDAYLGQPLPTAPTPPPAPAPALTQGLAAYLGSPAPTPAPSSDIGLAQLLGGSPMGSTSLLRKPTTRLF